uniref:antitrypsin-like isoform X2 n=1 Tax=Osmia lignaria TaxID=473952 RepID=UPI00147978E1|nr:antitrypsin-like isoform X2 [Osmia lignaria]XP_034181367.1 antitrypsin-like isoform X2 [Osmia lignaria]XP_034181368.1 antitrypsin-like isoform X2 [Osmia lignaria]
MEVIFCNCKVIYNVKITSKDKNLPTHTFHFTAGLKVKKSFLSVCLVLLTMAKAENNTQAFRAVSEGINQFSSSLFQCVLEENHGNIIMSPLSAAVVLAMAAFGARGETEKQLKKALHIPSPDTLGTSGYQSLIDDLNNVKVAKLLLANKVFAAEKFSVKPAYIELTEKYFHSVTQLVNFAKSEEAANTINTWVKQNTNDRIKEIVNPGDLNSMTAMVLVNAVYFKGQWQDKFDPQNTEERPFHVDENTVKNVSTMFRSGSYLYGELSNLNAKFVLLPYKDDELSMIIILPNEINGLAEVEKKLQNTNIMDILHQGHQREVELYLPKFKIESKIELNEPLNKLGLTDMFTSKANFSGIADADLVVSKVVQKAFIEVNEEGSEAAAATAVIFALTSLSFKPPPLIMRIDRPWLYLLCRTPKTNPGEIQDVITLFSGHVTKP